MSELLLNAANYVFNSVSNNLRGNGSFIAFSVFSKRILNSTTPYFMEKIQKDIMSDEKPKWINNTLFDIWQYAETLGWSRVISATIFTPIQILTILKKHNETRQYLDLSVDELTLSKIVTQYPLLNFTKLSIFPSNDTIITNDEIILYTPNLTYLTLDSFLKIQWIFTGCVVLKYLKINEQINNYCKLIFPNLRKINRAAIHNQFMYLSEIITDSLCLNLSVDNNFITTSELKFYFDLRYLEINFFVIGSNTHIVPVFLEKAVIPNLPPELITLVINSEATDIPYVYIHTLPKSLTKFYTARIRNIMYDNDFINSLNSIERVHY